MRTDADIRVLWLRPTVGTHISTRRERIQEGLIDRGVSVDIVNASGTDAAEAIRTALTGDYDLVVGTVRVGVYYGHLLSRLEGVPFVAEVTEPIDRVEADLPRPVFRFFRWYEWKVLARADACFFVEQRVLNRARQRGIDGYLARNSVWYERFADPDPAVVDRASEQLASISMDVSAPLAIYIGGFTKQQHIPEILDAARQCPRWEFLFLGEEGEHADLVEQAASSESNIHYGGVVPHEDVAGYLSFADVGFSLTHGERPLKLLEYGAAGLSVLGIPGKRQEFFSDEEIHFIEPTPEAIADALDTLRSEPESIPADGSALQRTAKENSWDSIAQQYYDVFRELLDR
ncbi:Glycosyltransferase involved in cell wall bisynthesis [Halovenus aranensis]|uniref:Glycosyltransferase involved in cell wall bisynthesis n=1 Tax=Halovenus aranensis TaxID=890420 RepID=A0A1G8SAN6_9EURY|nr:glycosyltransferase [Halovenus aranensis]SDJ26254.1 Glycosyltransferase involved in cell wall bisynthesis [Halovenus aranensis]